ncbi:phage integrase SAM-like domain-containing protein [Winogradskyella litorisediminis]|uniref:Phage integrase SAM-like domain-containing protein n=1 Tax=Winogradskyella litorisediminis TaxID=1156618 RepID=A0ABW3N502_9FLAO
MSKISFYIKNKKTHTTLYVRFSVKRGVLFRKSTQLQVDPKFFNTKTGKLKNLDNYTGGIELKATMEQLRGHISSYYNSANSDGEYLDSKWFGGVVNTFFNRVGDNKLEYLEEYAKHYVEKLPNNRNKNGTIGCTRATIVKYNTIHRKIVAYETSREKKYKVSDVGSDFRDDFLSFLIEELNFGENTAGRYIKFLKTVCLNAKRNGVRVHHQLESIQGFIKKTDKITLSFKEIEMIEKTVFEDKNLSVARDWLIIGCYLGQRVSDLLDITTDNLITKSGHRMIELTQQKTKKRVSILVHPKVEGVLKKYKGKFPPRFRESIFSNRLLFNEHIKEVARLSGLTEMIYGGLIDKSTRRKVWSNYPKYKLVSSHIMRRTFATLFYGDIPTALLISVTGHSTEKMFLQYIGKADIDYAEQLSKYWKVGNSGD